MTANRTARIGALALVALAAALPLAGCGKLGELDRPAPLVGHGTRPNAQTQTRQTAAQRARDDAARSAVGQAPQSADEVRNQGDQLPPPPPVTGTVMHGLPAGPNPQPPPGGLPNPLQPATVPQ